jgi:hypothetical protein
MLTETTTMPEAEPAPDDVSSELSQRRQRSIDHHNAALTHAMLALRGLGQSDALARRLEDELVDMLGERALRTGRQCAQPLLLRAPGADCAPARATRHPSKPHDVLPFPPSAEAHRLHAPGGEARHPKAPAS